MMFGIVGLASLKESSFSGTWSIILAVAAGAVTVYMLAWLFSSMRKLSASGNLDLASAQGKEGTVYLSISGTEGGKVELVLQNRLTICEAISEDGSAIEHGAKVKVTGLRGSNILIVKKT